jgi:hypothetical protein
MIVGALMCVRITINYQFDVDISILVKNVTRLGQSGEIAPYLGVYVNKHSVFLPKDPTEKVSTT